MTTSPFDMRQLEAFLAVMTLNNVTRAARSLGRSQPVVTRQIRELESDLGFALFERNGPRLSPTERGIRFHIEVERYIGSLRAIRERADAILNDHLPDLHIAAAPALAAGLLPRALARFEPAEIPEQVHVLTLPAESVAQSVLSRAADIGMASMPKDLPGLTVHLSAEVPCVGVVSENDPLAGRSIIHAEDLRSRRIITPASPYRLRRGIEEALGRAGVAPAAIMDTNASFVSITSAQAGLGVAIVDSATVFGLAVKGIRVLPLDIQIPFRWSLITAAGHSLTPTVSRLVEKLIDCAETELPGFRRCET